MFDPKQWVHCKNVTVKQLIEYLQKYVTENALFFVCGNSQVYMHMESDGSVLSVDDCSLSDLEEYEDHEVRELEAIQNKYCNRKNSNSLKGVASIKEL